MSKFGVGKVFNVGGSTCVRLPSVIVKDGSFKFKEGQEVLVKISGDNLIVVSE